MAKIQKKQKEKRLKKHLHLSITAELYNEVKKIGLNVSVFLEKIEVFRLLLIPFGA